VIQLLQQREYVLSRYDTGKAREGATLDTYLGITEELSTSAVLVSILDIFAFEGLVEEGVPISIKEHLLHLRHRATGGVGGTDDRTHTRAGDDIYGDAIRFEYFEYTYVRHTQSATTRQHETDLRSLVFSICGGRSESWLRRKENESYES
jgi:hypothetical protein